MTKTTDAQREPTNNHSLPLVVYDFLSHRGALALNSMVRMHLQTHIDLIDSLPIFDVIEGNVFMNQCQEVSLPGTGNAMHFKFHPISYNRAVPVL
jgi:hypothetical protein